MPMAAGGHGGTGGGGSPAVVSRELPETPLALSAVGVGGGKHGQGVGNHPQTLPAVAASSHR